MMYDFLRATTVMDVCWGSQWHLSALAHYIVDFLVPNLRICSFGTFFVKLV